jgi:hypothetical protein
MGGKLDRLGTGLFPWFSNIINTHVSLCLEDDHKHLLGLHAPSSRKPLKRVRSQHPQNIPGAFLSNLSMYNLSLIQNLWPGEGIILVNLDLSLKLQLSISFSQNTGVAKENVDIPERIMVSITLLHTYHTELL